jgi:hypothetical protein
MWNQHVYEYCERGHSDTFWAEPFNAITNGAFILAGIAAIYLLLKGQPKESRYYSWFLAIMLFVIGVGSFFFHTLATTGAELGDVIPISVFVFSYLIFSLHRFLRLSWSVVGIIMVIFAAIDYQMSSVQCALPATPPAIGDSACLWGSVAYFPPLAALWLIGVALWLRAHEAAKSILLAGAIFSLSLLIRTLDVPICDETLFAGKHIGMHFLWHCFNACTLYVLLRAAIIYGQRPLLKGALA